MKRSAKAVVLVTLISIICASLAFAESDILDFTFSTVKSLAVENSKQMQLDEMNIESRERELTDAYEEAEENRTVYGVKEERLKRKIIHQVDPLIAETNLEMARRTKEENIRQLENNTYLATMDVLLISKELEKERQKLSNTSEIYELKKAKSRSENVTQIDLSNSLYDVENKKIRVRELEYKLQSAIYKLNGCLGLPPDSKTAVDEEIELVVPEMLNLNLEDVVEYALANDLSVFQKAQDLRAKQLTHELTAEEYKEDADEHKEAKYDVELAVVALENAQVNLEVDILNKYNELLNNVDQHELASEYLELRKQSLDASQLQYDLGRISREELFKEQESLLEAQYDLYVAIHNLNKGWVEFSRYMVEVDD